MFARLYQCINQWAVHRYAVRILIVVSFIESIFFPIPTDVLLAPIVLRKPQNAIFLALVTTIASVTGGFVGYALGLYAFEQVEPLLKQLNYYESYQTVVFLFRDWGFGVILIAGFSPLPYKLFTIGAGALSLGFWPFLLASLIGRGARFFLLAKLVAALGPKVEPTIKKYIEYLGWICVLLLLGLIVYSL